VVFARAREIGEAIWKRGKIRGTEEEKFEKKTQDEAALKKKGYRGSHRLWSKFRPRGPQWDARRKVGGKTFLGEC